MKTQNDFISRLKDKFGLDSPIFTEEIISLFQEYTKAYVFRLIKESEENSFLKLYTRGVYYIPHNTIFGESTLYPEKVAERKYVKDKQNVYGINSGLSLLNQFQVTTQMPNVIEIVTNKEATRKRIVYINGKEFIIRKSRCQINSDNFPEYTLLQLFTEIDPRDIFDDLTVQLIKDYIKEYEITKEKLSLMALYFPSYTSKNIIRSGIFNEIA